MRKIIPFALFAILLGCSKATAPHDRLNGTWVSDLMTVTVDFPNGSYNGVAMGQQFQRRLSLVSENANVVVFKAGDSTIVCQFQGDGGIMLTKKGPEGGTPIVLHRAKGEP